MTAHTPEPKKCNEHEKFEEAIAWLKGLGKWVLTLVGISAATLICTFGAVVKFGLDMGNANERMQHQILVLTKDVSDLKEEDKKICKEIQRIKERYSPFGGVKGDANQDTPKWSE